MARCEAYHQGDPDATPDFKGHTCCQHGDWDGIPANEQVEKDLDSDDPRFAWECIYCFRIGTASELRSDPEEDF